MNRFQNRPFLKPDSGAGDGGNNAPPSGDPPTVAPAPPAPEAGGSGGTESAPRKTRQRKPSQQVGQAAKTGQAAAGVASGVAALPAGPVKDMAQGIADAPAPGGLALLLALLLLLLFAVVPVNGGKTRLQLLWETINGKMALPGVLTQQQQLAAQQQAAQTASAQEAQIASQSNLARAAANAYQQAANAVSGQLSPSDAQAIYAATHQGSGEPGGLSWFDISIPSVGWDGLSSAGPEDY